VERSIAVQSQSERTLRIRSGRDRIVIILHRIVIGALLLFCGLPVFGETFYVSATGNDSNGGRTIDTSWRTIDGAMKRIAPGDRIQVRGGVYHESINLDGAHSGTPAAPKVIEAYPGETPILDGKGVASRYPLSFGGDPYSHTPGASYWVVDGLTIRD